MILIGDLDDYCHSSDLSHSCGQCQFGLCLENCFGVAKDSVRAADYFRVSVDQRPLLRHGFGHGLDDRFGGAKDTVDVGGIAVFQWNTATPMGSLISVHDWAMACAPGYCGFSVEEGNAHKQSFGYYPENGRGVWIHFVAGVITCR
jgi:hypothetical protein